jgi:uncharacterized repeat protein (TIGR02543 family)
MCVAIDPKTPTIVYAGTWDQGVFRSTNSGTSWTAVNSGLTDPYIYALAVDSKTTPPTLYAGTDETGVFRSTNSGTSWTAVNSGLASLYVWSLAIDPKTTPSTLYAGTNGNGVYRSTDSGASWTPANTNMTDLEVWCLAVDPFSTATLYAGTWGDGVYRSSNSGTSWTAVNTGLTGYDFYIQSLAINPATGILYAGTDGGGICRFTANGAYWTAMNTGLANLLGCFLVIDPVVTTTFYTGTWGDGVYLSTDSCATWSAMNTGITGTYVQYLAINPSATALYAATSTTNGRVGGLFRYDATSSSCILATTSSPSAGGTITRAPDASSYTSGTVVTLTANASPGYHFVNWSGDLTGTTNPTTITMDGNKTVTAVFALTTTSYTLSLLPSWNVISVPFPTPVGLLPTCDLFLSWDGSLWQSVTTLLPGTGYLVRNTVGATTVTLTGLPSSSPQTQPATGTWQIIGNPYTTPASFACTSSVPYLLFWDGSLWQLASPTNLPPGLGFLLQASSPGTITLTRLP